MSKYTNDPTIADEKEVLQCMTAIMRSEEASANEKLRAAEKLGSLLGLGTKRTAAVRDPGDAAARRALNTMLEADDEQENDRDR